MNAAPRWSPARCQFTLIAITALIDRQLTSEEEFEALAIASRSASMHELDLATTQEWLREVVSERADTEATWRRARKAVSDFPRDDAMQRAIYAHCADIAYADRTIERRERRFLTFLAEGLSINAGDRRKIDEVMALKNAR